MQPKRQPKVHTYSRKRRRKASPGRMILSIGFTFLAAGAVGVVGYSIAKPILQYSGAESSITAESTAEPPESGTVAEEAAVSSEAAPAVTTEAAEPAASACQEGYVLPVSSLDSMQTFSAAVASARTLLPDGELLVIPLKIAGGELRYQTSVELAKTCGAAKGSISLSEMVQTAQQQGWTPVAQLSLLQDHLLPDADADAGFRVTDGSRWLDNTKENGGKAWTSPFSTVTIQYLQDITEEVTTAGFSQIWCRDVIFPSFRDSDLTYIGESVQDPERGQALVQLVNRLAQTAGNVPLWLETDALAAADGTAEVFVPEQLNVSGTVLDFQEETGQAAAVLSQVQAKAPEMPLCIAAEAGTDPADEIQQLKTAAGQRTAGVVLTGK